MQAAGSRAVPGTTAPGGALETGVLPRNETLFYGGINWGEITRWNPYGIGGNTFGITNDPVACQIAFVTLFLFNLLYNQNNMEN